MKKADEVGQILNGMFQAAVEGLHEQGTKASHRHMSEALHTIALFAELDAFDRDKVATVRAYAEELRHGGPIAARKKRKTEMPSVGEPGYVPYCGGCSTMMRMHRDEAKQAFVCRSCGLETRMVNGQDMFDQTAPIAKEPVAQTELERQIVEAGSSVEEVVAGIKNRTMSLLTPEGKARTAQAHADKEK